MVEVSSKEIRNSYNSVISIHAPREGSDSLPRISGGYKLLFQSTPPARGAT